MDFRKIEAVWELMSKNSFSVTKDSVSSMTEDLKCLICKKLLVNAVVSGICGCTYCYNCICEYTSNGDVFCPGNKQYCNDEHIVIDRNAFKSSVLNKRISKLKVNCPNESCDCGVELLEMDEHLRSCSKQPINCPFAVIGCDCSSINRHSMESHLSVNAFSHSELLIDLVHNLRNDLGESKLEIIYLQEELMNKDLIIEQLRERFGQIEASVNDEGARIERGMEEQRQHMEAIRNELENVTMTLNDNKDDTEMNREEIASLEENRIVVLEDQLRRLRNEMDVRMLEERNERIKDIDERSRQIEDLMVDRDIMKKLVDDLRKNIDEITEDRRKDNEDRKRRLNNWIKLCPNFEVDYVWKIDQLSTKKRHAWINSDSFYLNNYNLYMSVFLYGSGDIRLCCYIMKGDNDDKIEWPMRRAVTLSIVDQVTLTAHKCETCQVTFHKPKNDRYDCIGALYIEYSSVKDTPSITVDDSIVVLCIIGDP